MWLLVSVVVLESKVTMVKGVKKKVVMVVITKNKAYIVKRKEKKNPCRS